MTWGFWIFVVSVAVIVHLAFRFFRVVLRDYFAAKSINAVMAPNPVTGQMPYISDFESCADCAYAMADAMLKARSK